MRKPVFFFRVAEAISRVSKHEKLPNAFRWDQKEPGNYDFFGFERETTAMGKERGRSGDLEHGGE